MITEEQRTLIIGNINGVKFDFSRLKKQKQCSITSILENENDDFEYLKSKDYTLLESYKKQLSGLIFVGYRNKNIRVVQQ